MWKWTKPKKARERRSPVAACRPKWCLDDHEFALLQVMYAAMDQFYKVTKRYNWVEHDQREADIYRASSDFWAARAAWKDYRNSIE